MDSQPRLRPILRRVAMVLVALVLFAPATALAGSDPGLTLTGEPTEEEAEEIMAQWARFLDAFGGFSDCMGPIEVRVVARAEDWYRSRDVGPIAAFYTFPPDAVIFIEHRKVVARNLLHEFAHHLDVSCDLGRGPTGDALRAAHGIPSGRGWYEGGTWGAVPAEAFAEAVLVFFGEATRIQIGAAAVEVVDGLADVLEPEVRARQQERVRAAVWRLLLVKEGESLPAGSWPGLYAL